MAVSEPGEMNAPVELPLLLKAKPLGKFDMHMHTSKLKQRDLDDMIVEFGIPLDLHPMLPPSDLTMNELPGDKIGVYVQHMRLGGVRIPFSAFLLDVIDHFNVHISQLVPLGVNRVTLFEVRCYSLEVTPTVSLFRVFYRLCKQGHWFSFEHRTGRHAKKCFREILTSLKRWKDFFFLIDRRAVPNAMPWRHRDSQITDRFPTGYSQVDANTLALRPVILRKPPNSLLWVYGLTNTFRISGHHLVIKNAGGEGKQGCSLLLPSYFISLLVLTVFSFL